MECFDGSEVTIREGNEPVVQRENCVVEEIKEGELRSRRGKFALWRPKIYTCLPVGAHIKKLISDPE